MGSVSNTSTSSFEGVNYDWKSLYDNRVLYATVALVTPAVTCFLWFFVSYHTSPLKKYPGPFLAGMRPPFRITSF